MASIGEQSKKEVAALIGGGVAIVVATLLLQKWPQHNAAPLALGLVLLVAGYRHGPRVSWSIGFAGGLLLIGVQLARGVDWHLFITVLVTGLVCSVFPIPWVERHEQAERRFEESRRPLEDQRQALEDELVDIRNEVREAERRNRETDALYHVGREISKVLTLSDMIDFSRESIQDTLSGLVGAKDQGQLGFTMLLKSTGGSGKYDPVAAWNVPDKSDQAMAESLANTEVSKWLIAGGESRLVAQVPSQKELKGFAQPPGVRSMASLPLLIRGEIIGLILVFDSGEKLDDYLFNNLKILASQIAIGVEKTRLYDQVQKLSITDGLTGLYVHRYFQERLDEEIRRAERYSEPLSFLMFDIDHFKNYNDTYGHLVGDAVLKEVAKVIRSCADETDIVSRYGGEEFAIILLNQSAEKAMEKAEKIRKAVEGAKFEFEGHAGKVTISGGVAVYPGDAMTKKGLVDRADQALYQAKKAGRNQILRAEKG